MYPLFIRAVLSATITKAESFVIRGIASTELLDKTNTDYDHKCLICAFWALRCTSPKALGWVAAMIFVSFVVVSTFMVLSLFIGIINEKMSLAKEQLNRMKKEAALAKAKAGDDDIYKDLKDLHRLSQRIKRLYHRAARLHQGMEIASYEVKAFNRRMMKRANSYQVSANSAARMPLTPCCCYYIPHLRYAVWMSHFMHTSPIVS